MCTSISYRRSNHYFGRNLDVEFSFHEQVVITPRRRSFSLTCGSAFHTKFAMIGMAAVVHDYPLYYEAANEKGLAIAGLNFPGLACYLPPMGDKINISPFEFIPWLLGQAETLAQAREILKGVNLVSIPFSKEMPLSPLHFMISDRTGSIIVEPTKEGLQIYDNPYDVLTNNPAFPYHLWNVRNYRNCSPYNGENRFSEQYDLNSYGVGMGAFGLPGDASSASRFVRAAYHLTNSRNDDTEMDNVAQFFHVLDSVAMLKGAVYTESGKQDITLYSCCINADKGIYYYKTYGNNQLSAIRLNAVDLDAPRLYVYDLNKEQNIRYDN